MGTHSHDLKFDLLRLLNSGGQADVFLGRLRATGGLFAVKVLRNATDAWARAIFRKEVERQIRVGGPNVVPPVTWNLEAEKPFVVLQYMARGSLAEEIQRRRGLTVPEAVTATHGIAVALSNLHARGVIHRDVKPGNVLVDDDGSLRLNDLGIAATMNSQDFVRATGFVGTPAYAAPEQLSGVSCPASDVYALGIILRELVLSRTTGQFDGLGQEALLVAERLATRDPRVRPSAREAVKLLAQLLDRLPRRLPSAPNVLIRGRSSIAKIKRPPAAESMGFGLPCLVGIAVVGLAALFTGRRSIPAPVSGS